MPDPRRAQGQRYPLAPCLVVLALGLLAGKQDLAEIQRFGTRLSQAQRKALGFWLKKGTKFYPAPTYTVLRVRVSPVPSFMGGAFLRLVRQQHGLE